MQTFLIMAMLPVIFLIHDFEEIIMFKPWLSKNREELKLRFPKFEKFLDNKNYFEYSTSGFSVAIFHEFLLISVVTYFSLQFNAYQWWFGAFAAYSIHLFMHIGQWIIFKKYVPVIITSILTLPYCFYAFHLFLDADFMTIENMIIWAIIGLVLTALSFPSAFYFASKFEKWKKEHYINNQDTNQI